MQNILQIKEHLKKFIFDIAKIQLNKFNYKILKSEEDLQSLLRTKYFGSFNYFGQSCLLVFTKFQNRNVAYLINKKFFNYHAENVNLDTMQVNRVNIVINDIIYDGTILDCIVYGNKSKKKIIITDGFFFKGRDISDNKYQHRNYMMHTFFEANYDTFNVENDHDIMVDTYHEMKEFVEILKNENINVVNSLQTRGLIFYPHVSGTKLIYLFNDVTPSSKQKMNKDNMFVDNMLNNTEQIKHNKKTVYKYVPKTDDDIYVTFEMRKTAIADNYKLYSVEKTTKNNKEVYQAIKMDFAYIPSAICSSMCRSFTSKDDRVLVKCKFLPSKGKWIPVELDKNRKMPTPKSDIENKIDIIVEEISEDESENN